MTKLILCFVLTVSMGNVHSESPSSDSFEQLKSLVGEWRAELPGFGNITSTVRLVSNGQAIEETIGTPADNEISVYTRDDRRILLTHFCAMTPDGHQVRLETAPISGMPQQLIFTCGASRWPSLITITILNGGQRPRTARTSCFNWISCGRTHDLER